MLEKYWKTGLLLSAAAAMAAVAAVSPSCYGRIGKPGSNEYIAVNASSPAEVTTEAPAAEAETEPVTEEPTQAPTKAPLTMPKGHKLPGSRRLAVEPILQNPELPTGCEVTALAAALKYCGFEIDKVELCDNFLPIVSEAVCTFDEAYVGDPKSDNGFGCNAPVIVETAVKYFESVDAGWTAKDLTGTDFQDLFYQIEKGRPVIVWASMGLKDVTMKLRWITEDGDEAWFAELEHCMVLTGYDRAHGIVYAADPLEGSMTYSLEQFESVYEQLGKQAVILYENEQENPL
ncbi:MAG: C39 family peptidase [Ruminococcus sp.]|nr:C39 family peptidase [Ruminococcus sp.]